MKIDIIIVYMPRYKQGHEVNFVPPLTGIYLAALTPANHQVRVIHQQVQPVPTQTEADLIVLSFFTGFAPEAYRLAQIFKQNGKKVIAGGPHATFWVEEALQYCDAVMIGEAESVWEQVLADADRNQLQPRYAGSPLPLEKLPCPRYELLPPSYVVQRVVQATRGCSFRCSFCSVPIVNPGFRMRPLEEVLAEIQYDRFPFWWQRKMVWFWDDNLTANRPYIKELLRAMIPLKRWWLTQASMDITTDTELLELMRASGCIGVFLGIESFGQDSLKEAQKRQNRVNYYRERIETLHQYGIAVMAGFIAGFDHDTIASIGAMADQLYEVGVDVPFLSLLTPYKGTPLYDRLEVEGRLLDDRGWEFYNGYNVAFQPQNMTAAELLAAHRQLWRKTFSLAHVIKRILRSRRLRPGAFLLSLLMNGFYGLKALRGNEPIDMSNASLSQPKPAPAIETPKTALVTP
uniref:Radical SAM domain protein n=1 Tax=Cyanothece sp. (strain PCC 7425 / ATCC 29141) TaxID=395961 RepID=B8HSF9_CYAP4